MRVLFVLLLLFNQVEASAIHFITYSSKKHPGLDRLYQSADKFGISLKVLGIPSRDYSGPDLVNRGNMDKIRHLSIYLQYTKIPDGDIILFLDAFDTLFLTDSNTILERFLEYNAPVVIGAERNCWPFAHLAEVYPEAPTRFRYINTGFFIGYVEHIKKMLKEILAVKLPGNTPHCRRSSDQAHATYYYLNALRAGVNILKLDYYTRLVANTAKSMRIDELQIIDSPPRLLVEETGNCPCVFHANGSNLDCYNYVYSNLFIESEP